MNIPPERRSLRRRLIAFAVVALLVLLGFIIRLAWLQLVEGDAHYAQATAPPSSSASSVIPGGSGSTSAPAEAWSF